MDLQVDHLLENWNEGSAARVDHAPRRRDYKARCDSLRDPLLNEQKEKDNVTLNVKDDDDDFDLGFKPVELVFKDLKYTVKDKDGKDLVLIQNINGYATPGRLTALMGTTGAGKST